MYNNPYTIPTYTPYSRNKIVHVNGENGAKAFQMSPDSDILLLDDTAPIIWLAQTDGAGYKTVTPYSITPYVPEPPVDLKGFEERLKKVEEMLNEQHDKSHASTIEQNKPNVWKTSKGEADDGYY